MAHPADGKRLITLFGGAAIQVDGAPIRGRATHRHPLALIALLVVNGGRPLTRDKLIALLWPERDMDAGRNLLKVNVHELRKEIGENAIRSTGDQLSADLTQISCDVADFLAAVERRDHETAAALYAGPFLDGFFIKDASEFDQWVEKERARLAGIYGASLDTLAERAETKGDFALAVKWRRAHATHDPYRADIAHRLVKSLAAAGDRAGAIQFAESFVERRRREFDISDDHNLVTFARTLRRAYTPEADVVIPTEVAQRPSGGTPVPAEEPPLVVQPEEGGPSTPALRASARDDRKWWFGFVAIVAIGAALIISKRLPRAATVATPASNFVAVTPFRVVGSDSSMRNALVDLLAARFTGESGAQSIDPATVARAWGSAAANGLPTLEQAIGVAKSLGAGQLVTGEIVTARDTVTIAARLYSVPAGTLLASARTDASANASVSRIADRVAIELFARAAGEPDDRVSDIARRPLLAARKYIAAQLAYRAARYAAAESLYAQALQGDSTFGVAGLGLVLANSWSAINEHYGVGRTAAVRNRAAMSPRDRAFVDAFFGPDPALGPPKPAPVYLKAWEDVAEKWPDWTEAQYQLGDRYFHFGGLSGLGDPLERARLAFRRALAQDSAFVAPLHHLIELYAVRGDTADLRAAAARYFAANPSISPDRSAIGWETAMGLGDSAALRRIRANLETIPREDLTRIGWVTDANGWPRADAERAAAIVDRKSTLTVEHERALILLYTLRMNAGQSAEAHNVAAALGNLYPSQPVGALWDMYAALFGDGDTVLAADAARRLETFARSAPAVDPDERDHQHQAGCLLGYRDALRGDLAAARGEADHLRAAVKAEANGYNARNARVCLAMLSATIAQRGHAPDAKLLVAQLDTILLRERVPPHAILEAGTIAAGRLHAALGDTAAALVAARRREHLTGDPLFLSTELRDEAVYAAALRDNVGAERARAHLQALRRK